MLPDGSPGVVCYFTDITERRLRETQLQQAKDEAESANRSKDHFLAVLSHELRTPLTAGLMAVSALEHDPDISAGLRHDITKIRRNVELESKLIDDLLDLSRITSGKVELKMEWCDLKAEVSKVCSICQATLSEKNLRLELDIDSAGYTVRADSARLHQILWKMWPQKVIC